jgi:CheY-like chemotaxis protein
VVDDAATVRMLSQETLELYSYRVLTADSKEIIYEPNMLQQ